MLLRISRAVIFGNGRGRAIRREFIRHHGFGEGDFLSLIFGGPCNLVLDVLEALLKALQICEPLWGDLLLGQLGGPRLAAVGGAAPSKAGDISSVEVSKEVLHCGGSAMTPTALGGGGIGASGASGLLLQSKLGASWVLVQFLCSYSEYTTTRGGRPGRAIRMSNSQSSPTVDLSDAQGQGIHMVQNQVSDDHVDNLDFEHGCDVDKDMCMSGDEDEIPLDSKKRKKRVDGLKGKDEHEAISRTRGAVRYVRNSPARWDSTYLMLEAATCLKRAFDTYEDIDLAYKTDLSKKPFDGVPIESDWDRAKLLLKFLKHFYNLTLCISGSSYVTSNIVFHEICEVDLLPKRWLNSEDVELSEMARKMKEKYDKYWGSIEKMNMVLYYGVILDPRHKLGFVEFSFDKLYGGIGKNDVMKESVRDGLHELFNDYKLRYGHTLQGTLESPGSLSSRVSSSSSSSKEMSMHDGGTETRRFSLQQEYMMYMTGGKDHVKSELEKYLSEDVEEYREKFDMLKWWKVNTRRFSILSKMARDILAVPVSTVASEAAFSTGGRVLDAFRSSLSPKIIQTIISAQDWIRKDSKPISNEEDLSEIKMAIFEEHIQEKLTGWPQKARRNNGRRKATGAAGSNQVSDKESPSSAASQGKEAYKLKLQMSPMIRN
ncbi:Zinc finger BED domain-containing protein RICESLEEPER 1 [Sesamum angolense]|uniref:Zinc finger BED domain-containing protein RICESLEEPER 1 n=1 Tax=Sesamum angolense TaxID=2727404 RepID=A0AAE1VWF0_9LAMI|nr:Zinc finger BED domain-containing protein RICESLEEPER 1 [Sesamum angolense]